MATNGKLKTKNLLIGVKTAASIFLHANYESKTFLGEILIEDVKFGVRHCGTNGVTVNLWCQDF